MLADHAHDNVLREGGQSRGNVTSWSYTQCVTISLLHNLQSWLFFNSFKAFMLTKRNCKYRRSQRLVGIYGLFTDKFAMLDDAYAVADPLCFSQVVAAHEYCCASVFSFTD